MDSFATIVNGFYSITNVAKLFILEVCNAPVYVSAVGLNLFFKLAISVNLLLVYYCMRNNLIGYVILSFCKFSWSNVLALLYFYDVFIAFSRFLFQQNCLSRSIHQRCSIKEVFLRISQNSQENFCVKISFLVKLQAEPATLLKRILWHRCYAVNFAKFLRTYFS